MKKSELKQIIKEEIQGALREMEGYGFPPGQAKDIMPQDRLGRLKKLLTAAKEDLINAPGPNTEETIKYLEQAIQALEASM
jgi:hypothetical protein